MVDFKEHVKANEAEPESKEEPYLFIGGPFHGETKPVDVKVTNFKAFASPPLQYRDGLPMLGGPPQPVEYNKARLGGGLPGREPRFKDVYVHDSLTSQEAVMGALQAALMQRWLES